ncbi:MAG TPA: hypothetical protein G4N96_02230 [Chloroflexi bacterium]|nr:hypothetical protein [Chloroflexota bacterium]
MAAIARIKWSEYMTYRAKIRRFDLEKPEHIVRHSPERYFDANTKRFVTIGRRDKNLVIIPYEANGDTLTPITVHAITRQQIKFRLKSGRFTYA